MELAFAPDAFEVKTFILLHHLKFLDLKEKRLAYHLFSVESVQFCDGMEKRRRNIRELLKE